MKALRCPVILTSCSTRCDGSLGLRLATPELKPEEKTMFFELQNQNCLMVIEPDQLVLEPSHEVKGEFDTKTPGQRLRATLFVWWKQQNEPGEFEQFYARNMEKLIDLVKKKLNPV